MAFFVGFFSGGALVYLIQNGLITNKTVATLAIGILVGATAIGIYLLIQFVKAIAEAGN